MIDNIIAVFKPLRAQKLLHSKKARQISSLYFSTILSVFLGIGTSVLNTRLLAPQQFGDLKFLQNCFAFFIPFITLGIFFSGSRLLAQNQHDKIRPQLNGALLINAVAIAAVLMIGFYCFSFFEESIFKNNLSTTMRIITPLLWVLPLQLCLDNILQGENKIYELSFFRLAPQVLYLLGAILFNYFFALTLLSALSIQLISIGIFILIRIIRQKPQFKNLKPHLSLLWQENKTYGFHVYIGAITGVVSADLGGLAIGYFIDNTHVGYYGLAIATAAPLIIIPNAIGTTFFKDFANMKYIPPKIMLSTIALSGATLCCFILIIKQVILFLYSSNYSPAVSLSYILSIACTCHGFGDFINRFMGAHGKGREMRNSNFAICIVNIVGYTLLVSIFGVIGAALTRLGGSLMYLIMMCYYYKKFRNFMHNSPEPTQYA